MTRKIAVIDGNSLMHRAFHAVTPLSYQGRATNALFGFMGMLANYLDFLKPDGVVCAFDRGKPAFRLEALEGYKAQRKPMDPLLKEQFAYIEEILSALHIPVVTKQGWEGDDILGSLSWANEQAGNITYLITGDRDAYQLVSPQTFVVNSKKDTGIFVVDEAYVLEHYGIRPDQVRDFLGLKGDSSDNIPGVSGIGPKSATKLLNEFESLEGVYDNLDKLKGKQLENLKNNKQAAFDSRAVATIVRDLTFDIDLEQVVFPAYGEADLSAAFDTYDLKTSALRFKRLLASYTAGASTSDFAKAAQEGASFEQSSGQAVSGAAFSKGLEAQILVQGAGQGVAQDILATQALRESYKLGDIQVLDQENLTQALKAALESSETIAVVPFCPFDFEAQEISDDDLVTVRSDYMGIALAGQSFAGLVEGTLAQELLVKLLTGVRVCAWSLKSLIELLNPCDTTQVALLDTSSFAAQRHFDVQLAAYNLNSRASNMSLDELLASFNQGAITLPCALDLEKEIKSKRSKKAKSIDADQAAYLAHGVRNRALLEAIAVLDLSQILPGKLESLGLSEPYYGIDLPLVKVLADMERTGVLIDCDRLDKLGKQVESEIAQVAAEIYAQAGKEFNIDSPVQLSEVLFEDLGLPASKKTSRGYSTKAEVLENLAQDYEICSKILSYRALSKINSGFITPLPQLRGADGRVHTTFNEAVTATGRLSSSEPNLQNIPVRSDLGKKIRDCFVALDEDSCFVSADYSQIELRLLAHLSQDKGLIDAFNSGADFHAQTAAQVFDVPLDKVTPELRSRAKAVNFGIVYGQTPFGLSKVLHIAFAEAKAMIDRYYLIYPQVRQYLDETVHEASQLGYAATMFGRLRPIPELASSNKQVRQFGARTAMNHPMQGSAADIIKKAMIEVDARIAAEGLQAKLLLQVHDELDFSCPKQEAERLMSLVKEHMEQVVSLSVPLLVDVQCGSTWAEAH